MGMIGIRPGKFVAAVALVVAGCGGGTGTLTGKVSYQGKPVVMGSVFVQAADGTRRVSNIEPDGTYTVLNMPVGPVMIAVNSPEPPDPKALAGRAPRAGAKPAPAAPAVDRSKWVRLPDKYADPAQSDVTTTVSPGTTQFDINLP
jgi:hypothetical protein